MRLIQGAASHVGLVRKQNEDSFVAGNGLYAVCDGMGGARAGEVASETACRTLLTERPTGEEDLRRSVDLANRAIVRQGISDPHLFGMGTTMTAAVGREGGLLFAHIGDSRAYLLHEGALRQVTEDHSLVGELMRRGQLTPEEAAAHPHRSVITRALGTEPDVRPDVFALDLEPGDRVLFCSDGLSGMVADEELGRVLGESDDPQAVADALVQAALAGGGEDNITVVVVMAVEEGDDADQATGVLAGGSMGGVTAFGPEDRTAEARGSVRGMRIRRGLGHLRRRVVILSVSAVLVLVLLGAAGLALLNSSVYFVGTYEGKVALYQGMPYTVLGRQLYQVVEVAPTEYGTLDGYVRGRVDAREVTTKEAGQRFIRGLAPGP